jgi:hypothetical protein
LFGEEVDFDVEGDVGDGPEQQYLDAVWTTNRKMTRLNELALNGGIAGHAFFRTKYGPGMEYPRLVVLDPANVTVSYDPDDYTQVTGYKVQWTTIDDGKPVVRRQLFTPTAGVWLIQTQEALSYGNAIEGTWVTIADDEVWNYPFAPINDCQNLPNPSAYYGLGDLEDALLKLITSINRNYSNWTKILWHHAHPKSFIKGVTPEELKIAPEEALVSGNPDASWELIEMQSDLASVEMLINKLTETLFEASRIPEVARGKLETSGDVSGAALKILYGPALEKTADKRRLYGDMLTELNRQLLILGGFENPPKVALHWPNLVPADPQATAQAATFMNELGVSRDTLISEMGFDASLESRKSDSEPSGGLAEE